jgi:hypothetical protein
MGEFMRLALLALSFCCISQGQQTQSFFPTHFLLNEAVSLKIKIPRDLNHIRSFHNNDDENYKFISRKDRNTENWTRILSLSTFPGKIRLSDFYMKLQEKTEDMEFLSILKDTHNQTFKSFEVLELGVICLKKQGRRELTLAIAYKNKDSNDEKGIVLQYAVLIDQSTDPQQELPKMSQYLKDYNVIEVIYNCP